MPLSGVNKLCQQCRKSCKQWSQVTIVKCNFESNQKGGKVKHPPTLKHTT